MPPKMIACFKHFWSPTIDPRQQCFVHMVHGGFRLWVPLTHRLRARGWRIGNVFQSIVQKWYPRVSYLELTGLSRLSRTSLCDNSLVSSGTWWVAGYRGHRRFFSVGVLNFYYSNLRTSMDETVPHPYPIQIYPIRWYPPAKIRSVHGFGTISNQNS